MTSVRTKFVVGTLLTTLAALTVSGAALLAFDLHTLRSGLRDDLSTQAELMDRAFMLGRSGFDNGDRFAHLAVSLKKTKQQHNIGQVA